MSSERLDVEHHLFAAVNGPDVENHPAAFGETPEEQFFGQRAAHLVGNQASHRTGAHVGIIPVFGQPGAEAFGVDRLDSSGLELIRQLGQELVHHGCDGIGRERRKAHHRVECEIPA